MKHYKQSTEEDKYPHMSNLRHSKSSKIIQLQSLRATEFHPFICCSKKQFCFLVGTKHYLRATHTLCRTFIFPENHTFSEMTVSKTELWIMFTTAHLKNILAYIFFKW